MVEIPQVLDPIIKQERPKRPKPVLQKRGRKLKTNSRNVIPLNVIPKLSPLISFEDLEDNDTENENKGNISHLPKLPYKPVPPGPKRSLESKRPLADSRQKPGTTFKESEQRRSFGPFESGQKRSLAAVVSGQKRSIAATDLGRSSAAQKSKHKRQILPDEPDKLDQTNHKKTKETSVPKLDKQSRPIHNKTDQAPVPKPRRVPAPQINRTVPPQAAVVEKQDEGVGSTSRVPAETRFRCTETR